MKTSLVSSSHRIGSLVNVITTLKASFDDNIEHLKVHLSGFTERSFDVGYVAFILVAMAAADSMARCSIMFIRYPRKTINTKKPSYIILLTDIRKKKVHLMDCGTTLIPPKAKQVLVAFHCLHVKTVLASERLFSSQSTLTLVGFCSICVFNSLSKAMNRWHV